MWNDTLTNGSVWFSRQTASLAAFEASCAGATLPDQVPQASDIVHQIPVYDGELVRRVAASATDHPDKVQELKEEWVRVLLSGAGVVLIRQAENDSALIDEVTSVFHAIIRREAEADAGADHFAPAGSNTRIWNAHEKLCVEAPELFARYNANDVMALMCEAWLGPGYQITAQANIVHPGGRAQHCHRDYHMGFQAQEALMQYPAHVHALSPVLTLQGAIAHTDMPLASGPTKVLPFSQRYLPGYLACAKPDFVDYFEQHHAQVALGKGDMLFFNPALMHAAGDNNTSDVDRFANLVQVGSVYGRTMELLDRSRMCMAVYPALQRLSGEGYWTNRHTRQVIAASAEGYPFPANMELEPPLNGLAPQSQQDLMMECLAQGVSTEDFAQQLELQRNLKRSH